jgi:hypothetical protein
MAIRYRLRVRGRVTRPKTASYLGTDRDEATRIEATRGNSRTGSERIACEGSVPQAAACSPGATARHQGSVGPPRR